MTVHTPSIQLLATEMYKVRNAISPSFICELFPQSDVTYNLRINSDFVIPRVNTVFWGTETLRVIGPKIWDLLPLDIKMSPTLDSFKLKIKHWQPPNCPCRLCKTYLPDIGFI